MVMGCHEFTEASWTYAQLKDIHDALMDRLLKPHGDDAPCQQLSVDQLMQELLPNVASAYDCIYSWIDAMSGTRARISLQHVFNYVYNVDGGNPIPVSMENSFGSSFCEAPRTQDPEARPQHQGSPPLSVRSNNASSFFDATAVDDDVEVAADEAVLAHALLADINENAVAACSAPPQNRLQHPRQPERDARQLPLLDQETSEGAEILDLVRTHKSHLLPYYLDAKRIGSTGTKRTAVFQGDDNSVKRSKFSFDPSTEQRLVHEAISSDAHRGKSPSVYVELLVSNSEIQLWAYPRVSTRAYDLQFGTRGLSLLHFTPVDQMTRLQRQRANFINMSDFSVSAKFLPAPDPSSWEEVLAGANGFLQYCFSLCDTATQHLATALYNFICALKGRELWPQNMLPTLILWVDSQLERYRNAVAADITNGTVTRHLIASRFTPDNLERHGILLTAQCKRMESFDHASSSKRLLDEEKTPFPQQTRYGGAKTRKVPDDTAPLIPKLPVKPLLGNGARIDLLKCANIHERGSNGGRLRVNGNTQILRSFFLNIEVVDSDRGNALFDNALLMAADSELADVVTILPEKGAAVDTINKMSESALFKASLQGHADVVSVLLENGAAIDQKGPNDTTALFGAYTNGHLDVVKLLIKNGTSTSVNGADLVITAPRSQRV